MVAVRVDEPRREHQPAGVDHLFAALRCEFADGGDAAIGDAHVDLPRRGAGAVDDDGMAHDEVGRCRMAGWQHGQRRDQQQ